jgi:hypothetical protein
MVQFWFVTDIPNYLHELCDRKIYYVFPYFVVIMSCLLVVIYEHMFSFLFISALLVNFLLVFDRNILFHVAWLVFLASCRSAV